MRFAHGEAVLSHVTKAILTLTLLFFFIKLKLVHQFISNAKTIYYCTVKTIINYISTTNGVGVMPYTYATGFLSSGCFLRMVCEKPKHVGVYIVLK